MNERVGLSSDMGDEWSSQTASKEQSDNANYPFKVAPSVSRNQLDAFCWTHEYRT